MSTTDNTVNNEEERAKGVNDYTVLVDKFREHNRKMDEVKDLRFQPSPDATSPSRRRVLETSNWYRPKLQAPGTGDTSITDSAAVPESKKDIALILDPAKTLIPIPEEKSYSISSDIWVEMSPSMKKKYLREANNNNSTKRFDAPHPHKISPKLQNAKLPLGEKLHVKPKEERKRPKMGIKSEVKIAQPKNGLMKFFGNLMDKKSKPDRIVSQNSLKKDENDKVVAEINRKCINGEKFVFESNLLRDAQIKNNDKPVDVSQVNVETCERKIEIVLKRSTDSDIVGNYRRCGRIQINGGFVPFVF